MGYNVGAAGAFGILLSEQLELKDLYREFWNEVDAWKEADDEECFGRYLDDMQANSEGAELLRRWEVRFREALANAGVNVPETAALCFSHTGDDPPGRQATSENEWILGFGLFTRPWEYPPMDQTFRDRAAWHTWVWGG